MDTFIPIGPPDLLLIHIVQSTASVYSGYQITIGVGTPPQPMTVVLDINSPDTFIESIDCKTILCSETDTQYDSRASSTFFPNGTAVRADNEWVDASGFLSRDTFTFGHITGPEQVFQESIELWPIGIGEFPDELKKINGQLGLAPYAVSSSLNIPSPFRNLVDSGFLDSNLFALRLASPGQLSLGSLDDTLYQGPIQYMRLTHELDDPDKSQHYDFLTGRWQTPATHMSISSASDPNIRAEWSLSGRTASFTTADPFIYLPYEIVLQIYRFIGIDPFVQVPPTVNCLRRPYLPNVTLSLDGREFVLSGFDYTMEWHDDEIGEDENQCAILFFPLDGDSKAIVLGSGFLKNFYAVFDLDGQRIGRKCVCFFLREPYFSCNADYEILVARNAEV